MELHSFQIRILRGRFGWEKNAVDGSPIQKSHPSEALVSESAFFVVINQRFGFNHGFKVVGTDFVQPQWHSQPHPSSCATFRSVPSLSSKALDMGGTFVAILTI